MYTIPSKVGEQLGTLNDLFKGKGYYCMTTLPIGLSCLNSQTIYFFSKDEHAWMILHIITLSRLW